MLYACRSTPLENLRDSEMFGFISCFESVGMRLWDEARGTNELYTCALIVGVKNEAFDVYEAFDT